MAEKIAGNAPLSNFAGAARRCRASRRAEPDGAYLTES